MPLLVDDDGLSIRGRREGRCERGGGRVEAWSRLLVSSLLELENSSAESEAEELVMELL